MNQRKKEIIPLLESQSTILSFPERGECGDSRYPGNWSMYIPMFFWNLLEAKSTAECFAGSGTSSDAAKIWEIPYCGIDLNPNPVRNDIVSMDIMDLSQDLPDAFRYADVVLDHDPYPGMNHIKYAGKAWKDPDGTYAKKDIQNMDYYTGIKALDFVHGRLMSAMAPGSFLVVMCGEIRAKGQYHSMYKDMAVYGQLWQSFVKIQHNTKSGFTNHSYNKTKRALTSQEMILVMRKPSGYEIAVIIPREYQLDMRKVKMASWSDLVMTYAREKKTCFTNNDLYSFFEGHEKCRNNSNVPSKLRQTCQRLCNSGLLIHMGEGKWRSAS